MLRGRRVKRHHAAGAAFVEKADAAAVCLHDLRDQMQPEDVPARRLAAGERAQDGQRVARAAVAHAEGQTAALMILGMNANKAEDMLSGGLGGYALVCAGYTLAIFLAAQLMLTKRDVRV